MVQPDVPYIVMSNNEFVGKRIGHYFKQKRQALHESIAEVSGAVEIDDEMLKKIESGSLLPSEDILLLLISHFGIEENQAMHLLELAGYDKKANPAAALGGLDEAAVKQMFMLVPVDNRVLYSDSLDVDVTKSGVVLDFLQSTGNGPANSVSRIGMSREQLVEVIAILQTSLSATQSKPAPKQLPSATKKKHAK